MVLGNEVDDETHAVRWGGYRRAVGTAAVVVPRHGDRDRAGGSVGDNAATTGWQCPVVGSIPLPAIVLR